MMKKTLTMIVFACGFIPFFAQSYTAPKNHIVRADDLAISVKEQDKGTINWKYIKKFFADKNENDSIQLSVFVRSVGDKQLKTDKKYTMKGIAKNIDEIIFHLREKLN